MLINDSDMWPHLFGAAQATIFRLEARRNYWVDKEEIPFVDFMAGKPSADDMWTKEYSELIKSTVDRGVPVTRWRILDDPLTDYQRWQMSTTYRERAGEIIRHMSRLAAKDLRLPEDDFWLFDDNLYILRFGADDRFAGAERITNQKVVRLHIAYRQLLS